MRAIARPRLHPSTRDRSCFILTLCVRQTDFPLVLLLLCEAPASVSSSLKSALITCKHSHIRPPERRSSSSNESLRWPFKPHEVKPHTHTHTALPVLCLQVCFNLSVVSAVSHIKQTPASPEAAGLPGRKWRRHRLRRLICWSFKSSFKNF